MHPLRPIRMVAVTAALLVGSVTAGRAESQRPSASPTVAAMSALRPGDGLRVRIFREPELSGEFLVDERGVIVLPKLGEWNSGGVPADSVRGQLLAAYRKYLTTDAIEITPFRRVAVTGSVLKPGLYPIDPSMSIGDAIILAGGVSPVGKRDIVELRLAGAQTGAPVASEQRLWDSGAGGVRQIFVPQLGWFSRNRANFVPVALSVIGVAVSALTVAVLIANTRQQ